jgi:hypothetical protein
MRRPWKTDPSVAQASAPTSFGGVPPPAVEASSGGTLGQLAGKDFWHSVLPPAFGRRGNLALGGDTMEMLRAVLDTNFWLATHVVVITLG